jgi:hypothetical protein
MFRKIIIVLATALAFGGAMPATTAFARGGGGGGHMGGGGGGHMGGGGGGHMGGGFGGGHMGGGFGGGHMGGGFGGGHIGRGHVRFHPGLRNGFGGFGFLPYDAYAYGNCYETLPYHTRTGWHTRAVYACG